MRYHITPILPWLACLIFGLTAPGTHALMSGALPDSPAARTDRGGTESPYAGVGSVTLHGQTFSGTLISPRHVLTAAHVVATRQADEVRFNLISHGAISRSVNVTAIHVHPAYSGFEPGRPADGDLAILELGESVPAVYPRYRLLRQPLQRGMILLLAGFGASGHGDGSNAVAAHPAVRRSGANRVSQIRPSLAGRAQAVYYFDFDGPEPEHDRFGDSGLGNAVETSLAGGDSGSPAFVRDRRGMLWLAGVNSFRFGPAPSFGNGGGGQVISVYAEWIDGILGAERR